MKSGTLAQLDILNTFKGHDKEEIIIKDDDPKKRKNLADKVTALVRDGYSILLADGRHVRGYDAETNEWLVAASDRKETRKSLWERVSARRKPANAIAPQAGG